MLIHDPVKSNARAITNAQNLWLYCKPIVNCYASSRNCCSANLHLSLQALCLDLQSTSQCPERNSVCKSYVQSQNPVSSKCLYQARNQKQRVSGSPYWAPLPCERKRTTRALFKPKWASGEILVHVIHAKQNETELH